MSNGTGQHPNAPLTPEGSCVLGCGVWVGEILLNR